MGISTTREALLAELMGDMDGLITRFEALDSSLSKKIEQSTKDGASKAYHSTELRFKSMFQEREQKLMETGRNAAALIGTQLNTGLTQLVGVNESLERKAWRFISILAVMAVLGGAIGGIVVVKLLAA